MPLEVGKRVILTSRASEKNLRTHETGAINAKGGEGEFAQWDVVEGDGKCVRLRSFENPNNWLCIREDGKLWSGKGGKLCHFRVIDHDDGDISLKSNAVVKTFKKKKGETKKKPAFVGALPNGAAKCAFKTKKGNHGQFVAKVIGESEPQDVATTRAGQYYTKRAGDVDVRVTTDPERKKALLVGCNYPGTSAALRGCVNDVWSMKSLLMDVKGFKEKNIRVLIDTDGKYERPTGYAIKKRLKELVLASKPGDVLMFHFSGHGTQVRAEGNSGEDDRKDEAIVPTDMNLIVDNDLRKIVDLMPHGVHFTFVSDCCHSGGMLDHKEVQIGEGKGIQETAGGDPFNFFGFTRDIEFDHGSRELSPEQFAQCLGDQMGAPVKTHSVRRSLFGFFGSASSSLASTFVQGFAEVLGVGSLFESDDAPDDTTEEEDMDAYFFGPPKPEPPPPSSHPPANLLSLFGGSEEAFFAEELPPTEEPYQATLGKPDVDAQLDDDKGVLICGCQSAQTSADVCPGGNPAKAFGALSNTLTGLVRSNPTIKAEDLVATIRRKLAGRFTQKPGLECSDYHADQQFICPSV